jgi:hypothetical protein
VHVIIPPSVIVRDHVAALDIMRGNGNVVDLSPETITHGIPLFPQLRHGGVDFFETDKVGLVIARVIRKDVRAGGHVNSLSQAPHPSIKAVTIKGIKHLVKVGIVLMLKLAQFIVKGRWNLKAV